MNTSTASRDYERLGKLCEARQELNRAEYLRYSRLLSGINMSDEKVALWRQKCADFTITREEYAEAIAYLRAGRLNAAPQPKVKKPKKAGKKSDPRQVDLTDLINELEKL